MVLSYQLMSSLISDKIIHILNFIKIKILEIIKYPEA